MIGRAAVVLVCLTAGWGVIARAQHVEDVPPRASFAQFPMQLGRWRGRPEPPFDQSILDILRVDDYLTRAYFAPDRSGAGLYVGYYRSQRQGDTMHSPLNCLPGAGWEPVSKATIRVLVDGPAPGASPSAIAINRYVVEKGLERQLVLYWYQSHGRVVASEYWSKFYLIEDAVRLNRTDGALVRVIVPMGITEDGERRAETTGIQFVRELFPVLGSYLPS